MTGFRTFALTILLASGASCSDTGHGSVSKEAAAEDPVINRIFGVPSSLFREASLGMSVETVKAGQKNFRPEEEETNYLSYNFTFADTLRGSYYFSFEDGLDEIGVDIFREKQKDCNWLYEKLKKYFTAKYGPLRQENELMIWHAEKQGKEGAEITLADESSDYGYGKLTITIFPFESSVDPKEKEADAIPLPTFSKESSN
jgi:hypothetical protein